MYYYINNEFGFRFIDKYLSDMIKRDILDSYMDVITSLFNKCKKSEKLGKIPLRVSDLPFYFKIPTIISYEMFKKIQTLSYDIPRST